MPAPDPETPPPPPTFAARLKAARAASGLARGEVARRAGLTSPGYSRLEAGGRANPAWSTLRRLIEAGLGLEHFFPAGAIRAAAARLAAQQKGPPGSDAARPSNP